MQKQISVLFATAIGLAVFAGPVAADGNGSVVIYRGAEAETVRFDNRGGVAVVRGQPAAKSVQPVHKAAYTSIRRIRAGNTLWIVEGAGKRVVACELRNTTQVGGRKIRCQSRRLR